MFEHFFETNLGMKFIPVRITTWDEDMMKNSVKSSPSSQVFVFADILIGIRNPYQLTSTVSIGLSHLPVTVANEGLVRDPRS